MHAGRMVCAEWWGCTRVVLASRPGVERHDTGEMDAITAVTEWRVLASICT